MSNLDDRIEVFEDVALARFETNSESELQARLLQIQEAKQIVDDFYTSTFKVDPLPFLLVVEKEKAREGYEHIEGPGKFIFNANEDRIIVPTVAIGHPSLRIPRLKRKYKECRESEEVAYQEATLRETWIAMHEYAHLYNALRINLMRPKWFDEGLATYFEKERCPLGNIHTRNKLRLNRYKGALHLVADSEFKPIYNCHEYDAWIAHLKEQKAKEKDTSNYDLAYVIVAECIKESGFEEFGKKIKKYFTERGNINTKFLLENSYEVPNEYTFFPEEYPNLVDILNQICDFGDQDELNPLDYLSQIGDIKSYTNSNKFSVEKFDEFFRTEFPATYLRYEKFLK